MSWNIKSQIKTYRFWLAIASAVLLLIQAIGEPLGLVINEEQYMSVINSVLGIFVVLGILSNPAADANMDKNDSTVVEDTANNTESIKDDDRDTMDGELSTPECGAKVAIDAQADIVTCKADELPSKQDNVV